MDNGNVPNSLPLQKQVHDLAEAKYSDGEMRWRTARRFFTSALPSVVTFGLGAAALTAVAVAGAAVFGIGGATAGLILPAAASMGIGSALISGIATGTAGAYRISHDIGDRNQAIDTQIHHLQAQALEQGQPLPEVPVHETPNPAKNSPIVQQIIERGKQTFSPVHILEQASQDAGLIKEPSR